jgi:3-hydroxyisobutyrate dehydrogenase-like beta-hydroxyacid dehydrogenase
MHAHTIYAEVIGILYPGEMGVALGEILVQNGFRVVTTTEGRSPRTSHLCSVSSLCTLATLKDVIDVSDVVISLVPPAAAIPLAQKCVDLIINSPQKTRIYLDANSISPLSAKKIQGIIGISGAQFCDASICGMAEHLETKGIVYVSGDAAETISSLFGNVFRIKRLSDNVGDASAMKMLIGGLNKGLAAQFIELSQAAYRLGLLEYFLKEGRVIYPDLFEIIDRILPTYPQHSARRSEEMQELAVTVQSLGIAPHFSAAASIICADLSKSSLNEYWQGIDDGDRSLSTLMGLVGQADMHNRK